MEEMSDLFCSKAAVGGNYNLTRDNVAVVGRFAGEQALAAVGSCVALVGIFVNLIVGLSVGPNAALANLIG